MPLPTGKTSRDILAEEILAQNHADGGNREQAFGYHLFVLQFLILARLTAERTGQVMPQSFDDRLSAMVEFAAAITDAGPAPMYGDADDGYVVDLGGRELAAGNFVAAGRALLGRQRPTTTTRSHCAGCSDLRARHLARRIRRSNCRDSIAGRFLTPASTSFSPDAAERRFG